MNFKTWTVGTAVLMLATAPAFAETGLGQWSYDQNVVPVGCDSCCDDCCCGDDCCGDDCCGDDCCGDCCCGDGCGCGCGVGGAGLFSGMGPGLVEGFSLSNILGFEAFTIGGWTQFGYTSQPTILSALNADPRTDGGSFNNIEDQVNLHQQWFYLAREADGSKGFDVGFRADVMYGVDGTDTQAFGNPDGSWDFNNGFDHGIYSWALPQLYGEVAINDLSVIIGHFYTLVGYEVVTAPDNFFFSHALTMYNSEPFTHTGVLGTYSGFENLTLYGGWTLGWDTGFDNLNQGNSWIGGFGVNLTDSISVTYINTYGNFGARDGGANDSYSHSIVADVQLTDNFNYVFQTDMVDHDDVFDTTDPNNVTLAQEGNQIGINQYLFYTFNDILTFGTRMEWWKNGGLSHCAYTGGVNVKLLDNLIWRPEYRKDWVPGLDYDEDIWACDMILTY